MIRRPIAAFAALLAAACASRSSLPVPPPGQSYQLSEAPQGAVTATFVIAVPNGQTNAQSVSISANKGPAVVHDLGPTVAGCTPAGGGKPLTCDVPVTAKTGTNTFALATFTQTGGGGSQIAGADILEVLKSSGDVLVTLSGTPLSIDLGFASAKPRECNATTQLPLFVAVLDATGEIIVNDSYGLTITLKDSDKSGATSLSTTTVTGSNAAVTLSYNGDLLKSATISASAPGISPSNVHNAALKPSQMTYVLDAAARAADEFPTADNGNVAPARRILMNGPDNGLTEDDLTTGCVLFASDSGNTLTAIFSFDARKNGSQSPATEITGAQTDLLASGVAVNPVNGMVYAPVQISGSPGIGIWPATANGDVAPSSTIIGSNTQITNPASLAFDSAGDLYVLAFRSVLVFAKGATGNATPVQDLATGFFCPDSVAVDASDQIYVSDNCTADVSVWAKGATGNAAPVRTITLPSGGGANGVGVDYAGNSYAADEFLSTVYSFGPTANGKATPRTTIAGSSTTLSEPVYLSL